MPDEASTSQTEVEAGDDEWEQLPKEETVPWKKDLAEVPWENGSPAWRDGMIDEEQFDELIKFEATGYVSPSFFITNKSTGERRFIAKSTKHALYDMIDERYAPLNSPDPTSPQATAPGVVKDSLIKGVLSVRYDIWDNGVAGYLVEWKAKPQSAAEPVKEEFIEEHRMPERFIQAHTIRRLEDTWEYGPIDIPTAPDDPIAPRSPSPALSYANSPEASAPHASQAFPMSPPRPLPDIPILESDLSSLESSDDEMPDLSQMLGVSQRPKRSPGKAHTQNQTPRSVSDPTKPKKISSTGKQAAAAADLPRSASSPNTQAPVGAAVRGGDGGPSSQNLNQKAASVPSHAASASTSTLPDTAANATIKEETPTTSVPGAPLSAAVPVLGRPKHRIPNTQPSAPSQSSPSSSGSAISKGKRKADSQSVTPSTAPPPKRSRLAVFHPTKNERFWHLDGNIIVNIDNIHFKLHRSRLAQLSEYFAELFDRKDGLVGAGLEEIDGRPVYTITGVSAEDFEIMLSALDDAITYYYSPPPLDIVASIIRVSDKLKFTTFFNWASQYLEETWSDDLISLTEDRIGNAFETALLGRNSGIRSVLKRSLYELLRTAGLGMDGFGHDIDQEHRDFIASETSRLVRAREKLNEAWNEALSSAFRSFSCPGVGSGETSTTCPPDPLKMSKWAELVYASGMAQDYAYDGLSGLKVLIDRDWKGEDGYCDACVKARRDTWQRQRERMWANLDLWLEI